MLNSMPSHMVIPLNTQVQIEGGRISPYPKFTEIKDVFQLTNVRMPTYRKKVMGFDHYSSVNTQNGVVSTGVPFPTPVSCRPAYNNFGSDMWNSNIQSEKVMKLKNGVSLKNGISTICTESSSRDDMSDSGVSSRSPTPIRQTPEAVSYLNGSKESLVEEPENRRGQEVSGQIYYHHVESMKFNSYHHHRNSQLNQNSSKKSRFSNNRGGRRCSGVISSQFSLSSQNLIAPDRFLRKAHLVHVKRVPEKLTNGSTWDKLSESVWQKFIQNQQTEETYRKKMILWKHLYLFIKSYFPKYGLYLVGSTMSGFGSDCSDVDMCLLVRHCELDQKNEAQAYLGEISRLLTHCGGVQDLELIPAKVPILKFRYGEYGLEVDLNCNNAVGIRNTHLLHCYSQLDWRVRPLVLVVKLWARFHNINDAKNMTISSYSLALMVIHFLQCGVSPPILPCLHALYRDKFLPDSEISSISIHEKINPNFHTKNSQSLGELLVQFFEYYTSFDYTNYAISVRLASVVPIEICRQARAPKNDPHQWKLLCIEEPFDLTNTARSVYDAVMFNRIRTVISKSAHLLMEKQSLEYIFNYSYFI